jgi:hypothetical protein
MEQHRAIREPGANGLTQKNQPESRCARARGTDPVSLMARDGLHSLFSNLEPFSPATFNFFLPVEVVFNFGYTVFKM